MDNDNMDNDNKEREKRETPIIDGDARPDMPLHPENKAERKNRKRDDKDEKFEAERSSDVNSLEDFKDAK